MLDALHNVEDAGIMLQEQTMGLDSQSCAGVTTTLACQLVRANGVNFQGGIQSQRQRTYM